MLFRGTDWYRELSPQEIQEIMGRANAWFERLAAEGKLLAANPLETEGATISHRNGTISDGPFAESKESVGGYVMVAAGSFDEAMAIARGNPMIPHGLIVEVRAVADICPGMRQALRESEAALA